jgi:hypothetical protein
MSASSASAPKRVLSGLDTLLLGAGALALQAPGAVGVAAYRPTTTATVVRIPGFRVIGGAGA